MASLEKQIKKTGNTDYTIGTLDIDMDNNVFVPIGAINELRRRFLEKVTESILNQYKRELPDIEKADEVLQTVTQNQRLAVSVDVWTFEQFLESIKADFTDRIYLETDGLAKNKITAAIEQGKQADKQIYIAMPYVFRKKDKEFFDRNLFKIIDKADGVLIRNAEQYYHLKNLKVDTNYIFDYNVYSNNKTAKDYYSDNRANKTTAPLELNYNELKNRGCSGDEVIVYGYMPVMISAGCGLKTCNLCHSGNQSYVLKDKKNNRFFVRCICSLCYNIMYNSKPLSLFKYFDEISRLNADSLRLSFTVENAAETRNILNRAEQVFLKGKIVMEDDKSTRGHFKRGVL